MGQSHGIELSPLMCAITNGQNEAAILLLDLGADVNKRTWLFTPMVIAINTGNSELVIELARRGAIMEGEYGRSSILESLCNLSMEAIEEILGLYPEFVDSDFLLIAARNSKLSVVKLLLNLGAKTPPDILHKVCSVDDRNVITFFLDMGFDINGRDSKGNCPIHKVTNGGMAFSNIEFLHSVGADINAKNRCGMTPLHIFADNKSAREFLIKNGADENVTDDYGRKYWSYTTMGNLIHWAMGK